jgi:beta-glucosidase
MTSRFDVPALLSDLTLEEKAAMCSGSGFWHTRAVERLGIPNIMVADGPHGLRKQTVSGDDVGMGLSVPATCFPTAAALGSSWDGALLHAVGVAVADEARAEDVGVVLGPGINIKRSPLCGRNFEYLSEDPVLSGDLGAAIVDGLQSRGVGASLKHYAVNNQETDRLRVSADVDDRPLREIYLAGFERVVKKAKPWTVMCSYNRINGVYASQDHWLLTEVLRDEWGFDGLVVSDWGAVDDNIAAVAAGLDLEMPSTGGVSAARLVDAVKNGELDEAVLDLAITRVLQLLDRALPGTEADDTVDLEANDALARSVGTACAVLLKNEHRGGAPLLPLAPSAGSHLAVIGAFARTPRFQGAGSSKVNPYKVTNALDELRAAATELFDDVTVDFADGFGIDTTEGDDELRAEAVALARAAETVVVFLGLPASAESEGFDRTHLDLPENQVDLLRAIGTVNERVVVVLSNGSVVSMTTWIDQAGAVLEGWLLGQAGGGALVDLLVGRANPSGKLAETIPLRLQDTPSYLSFPGEDSRVRYGEGLFVGYRYYDTVDRQVGFPFGHGLSYTTFEHRDLSVTVLDGDQSLAPLDRDRIEITVRISNTGAVAGQEVVQVYVGDPEARVVRPARELKAFAKVDLAPGATESVTFRLTGRDLAYWSTRTDDWELEGGTFSIAVGASSRDIRLTATVEVDPGPQAVPLHPMSTLQEWIDHPIGGAVLREALTTSPVGDLSSLIEPSEFLQVVSSVPLSRMILMVNAGFSPTIIDDLLAQVEAAGRT